MARPCKEKYNIDFMVQSINEYTDSVEIPVLKEICYENDWCYDYVMQLQRVHETLSHSIKRLLCKKESRIELGALNGTLNSTMAIFSLKQLGWRDKQEIALSEDDSKQAMAKYLEVVANGIDKETTN